MSLSENVDQLSFEKALKELEIAVRKLEDGSLPLEESIELFERGMLLTQQCEKKLKEASLKIEKITLKNQKPEGLESFDSSDNSF